MSQNLRELNEAKLSVFRTFAAIGKVLVVCDPTSFGVRVPEWLRKEYGTELTLRFGFKNGALAVDAQGISETLSFKGVSQRVSIPWPAVSAMVGEDGRVWAATSMPEGEEPAPAVAEAPPLKVEEAPAPPVGVTPAPRSRPTLRLVADPDPEQTS